jgi:hypothetical protein
MYGLKPVPFKLKQGSFNRALHCYRKRSGFPAVLFCFIGQRSAGENARASYFSDRLSKLDSTSSIFSGAKAHTDLFAFAARLKSYPFKTATYSEIPEVVGFQNIKDHLCGGPH